MSAAQALSLLPLPCCRQCSSGLQAIADVAAAIKAGFYTVGIGGGVETMSLNPMAWEGGVNPKVAASKKAQSCLMPMGECSALSSPCCGWNTSSRSPLIEHLVLRESA